MSQRQCQRSGTLLLVIAMAAAGVGCGSTASEADEPQTAREKQYAEAQKSGELDEKPVKTGGWQFKGDRKDCRYLVSSKCFKSEKKACAAAGCPSSCVLEGAGPASVSCGKK